MKRIVFMGAPDFALPALERLARSEYRLVAVYTQPDKPAGRGRNLTPSPVKEWAVARGLPVRQPRTLRQPDVWEDLRAMQPDLLVVAAYGKLLPPEVLAIPPYGCLNLHPSLLPRYRGASPVATALLEGATTTGVTLMLMDAGLDSGPILAQRPEPVSDADTTASLTDRLAQIAADVLLTTLPRWLGGKITPQPQDPAQATLTKPLVKEQGEVDWQQPAVLLWRQVRAYDPWPGSYTWWRGRRLRLIQTRPLPIPLSQAPGTVLLVPSPRADTETAQKALAVQTGEGLLELVRLQLEGKRELEAAAFLQGQPAFLGERLPS